METNIRLTQLMDTLMSETDHLKIIQDGIKGIKEKIILEMDEQKLDKIIYEGMKFGIVDQSQTACIDITQIKKESPVTYADLLHRFIKIKTIKRYLRISKEKE
ncbi:MAG: hypothetical protein ACRCU3_00305 [Eubacteriaceae bacterium]